jgi:hypothetical protein
MQNKLILSSLSLLLVGLFTTNNNFTNANAALTSPSSYDIAFAYSGSSLANWYLQAYSSGIYDQDIQFNRTADGSYYNYTATFDNNTLSTIPEGLTITNTFNRSNTSWTSAFGGYYPSSSTIGSNTAVGTISNKLFFNFDNQTNKNYLFYFDFSSTSSNEINLNVIYDTNQQKLYFNDNYVNKSTLKQIYLPSYTTLEISTPSTSGLRYFDAWYLKDLGLSASYTEGNEDGYYEGQEDGFDLGYGEGYEEGNADGYNEGYEIGYGDGFEANVAGNEGLFDMMASLFGGVGAVFNIYVLPSITLGMLVFVPIIFALLMFIIKILRGGS